MKVLFYGKLAAALGSDVEIALDEGCSVADLRRALADAYPTVRDDLLSRTTRACIGDEVVGEQHRLDGNARVELLPPVSGG